MTTLHLIENAAERDVIKRIFRQRVKDFSDNVTDKSCNSISGDMNINDNGSSTMIFNDGAIVYDIKDGGDPELGCIVYDFRGNPKCYTICESDVAGLTIALPSNVFPF